MNENSIFVADAFFPILWASFWTSHRDFISLLIWKFRRINRMNGSITLIYTKSYSLFVGFCSSTGFTHQHWTLNGMKCQ